MNLLNEQQISSDGFGIDNQNEELSWKTFPNEVDPSRGKNLIFNYPVYQDYH